MLLTSGLAASKRRRDGAVPSTGDGGRRQCGSSCTFGKTTTQVGWPTTISLVNRPNGSPVRTRSGAEPIRAAAQQRDLGQPLPAAARGDPDHPARQRRRQGRVVPQLHPWLAPAGLVVEAVDGLQDLAHLGARVQHVVAGAQPLQPAPRVQPRRQQQAAQQVDQEEEEADARAEGSHHQHGAEEHEPELFRQAAHVPLDLATDVR